MLGYPYILATLQLVTKVTSHNFHAIDDQRAIIQWPFSKTLSHASVILCYVVGYCMYIMYLYACVFSCRIALLRIDHEGLWVMGVL